MRTFWPIGTVFLAPTEESVKVLWPEDLQREEGRALARWPLTWLGPQITAVYVRGQTEEPLGPRQARTWLAKAPDGPPVACYPRKVPSAGGEVWVLDLHTLPNPEVPGGYVRSPVGELLYRLKYRLPQLPSPLAQREAQQLVPPLAATLAYLVRREKLQPQAVVPAPFSLGREFQPVVLLAQALAKRLGVPYLPLLQKGDGIPVKNLEGSAARLKVLRQAIRIREGLSLPEELILLDDLLETGATLQASAEVLASRGAKQIWRVTLTVDRRAL